jgi:hypothetical protein
MKSEYILLIVAGAIFLVLFIAFVVVAIKKYKYNKSNINNIKLSYVSEDLKNMGYDFTDNVEEADTIITTEASQVTIDDIVRAAQPVAPEKQNTDEEIFSKIENNGVEEIKGNFKS